MDPYYIPPLPATIHAPMDTFNDNLSPLPVSRKSVLPTYTTCTRETTPPLTASVLYVAPPAAGMVTPVKRKTHRRTNVVFGG